MGKGSLVKKSVLLTLVTAFMLGVTGLFGFILTSQSSAALSAQIRQRMLDLSNTAAAMLDGDSLAKLTSEDVGTKPYQSAMDILTFFQENIELRYIYCITETPEGDFVFSIDPTVDDPAEFGSPVVTTDALREASHGTPSVDLVPYHDAWGTFYSAYTPVFTSSGDVGAIVSVDFDAAWYEQQVSQQLLTVVAVGAFSLLMGIAIVIVVTRWYSRRYSMLYNQLNELAFGVEELVEEAELDEESLATVNERRRELLEERAQGDIDALGAKILSMQEEIRVHIERVRRQAYIDALTGIGNKTAYLNIVSQLEDEIKTGVAQFGVCAFDLNGLKLINDNHGHEFGDMALTEAAQLLRKVFGKKQVFRIGGDEFIAVVPGKTTESEMKLMLLWVDEALAELNREERPYFMPLSMSKGAAVFSAQEDADYISVFRRADHRMYDDKRAYYEVHERRAR